MLSSVSEPKRGTDPAGDFAEIWDSERRNASYLRVVTGGLLVLLLALSTGWCRSASRTLQPVFVRVDEIGRAEALDYAALTWQNDPLHPQGFSMFANKGWLTKEDGGGLDKPVLGVR